MVTKSEGKKLSTGRHLFCSIDVMYQRECPLLLDVSLWKNMEANQILESVQSAKIP